MPRALAHAAVIPASAASAHDVSDYPGQVARQLRDAPPPLEGNDRLITVVGTIGWAVALAVVLGLWDTMPRSAHWWVWTCLTGVGLGLFAIAYVPHLKRSRAKAADRSGGPSD